MRRVGRRRADVDPAGDRPSTIDDRALLVLSIAVTLPSVVAAVRALQWGWVPVGDQATIATRAIDVFSSDPPVLGQLSGLSAGAGRTVRSPGPMGYWPFAVVARAGPLWGPAVVAAALSAGCMVGVVCLAARRGGVELAAASALGLALVARAIGPVNLASTWNPAVGVMPLVLLVLLSWSVVAGEVRFLPLAVLVASFCAQVHTAMILPAAVLVSAAMAATALRRAGGRPVVAAAVVAAGCWALPVAEQVLGGGNLAALLTGTAGERSGLPMVGRVLADTVGLVPAFARPNRTPGEQAAEVLLPDPSTVGLVTAALAVLVLVASAGWSVRRGAAADAAGAALVLATLGAGAMVAAVTPLADFLVLTYTTWWVVPIGMLVWALLAARAARRLPLTGRRPVVVAGAVAVAVAGLAVLSPTTVEPEEPIHRPAGVIGTAVTERVGAGRHLVEGRGVAPSDLVAAVAYRLRRHGGHPIVAGNDGVAAGPRYVPDGRRCASVVTLADQEDDVPPGADVVAVVAVRTRDGRATTVWAAVGPDGGRRSC